MPLLDGGNDCVCIADWRRGRRQAVRRRLARSHCLADAGSRLCGKSGHFRRLPSSGTKSNQSLASCHQLARLFLVVSLKSAMRWARTVRGSALSPVRLTTESRGVRRQGRLQPAGLLLLLLGRLLRRLLRTRLLLGGLLLLGHSTSSVQRVRCDVARPSLPTAGESVAERSHHKTKNNSHPRTPRE